MNIRVFRRYANSLCPQQIKSQMRNVLVSTVFRYLKRRENGKGNVTKLQPKISSFHDLESYKKGQIIIKLDNNLVT